MRVSCNSRCRRLFSMAEAGSFKPSHWPGRPACGSHRPAIRRRVRLCVLVESRPRERYARCRPTLVLSGRNVAADVSIISYLFDLAALPRIPVASDRDQKRPERAPRQGGESRTFFHPTLPRRSGRRFIAFREATVSSRGRRIQPILARADIKFAPSAARNLQTLRYS